MTEETVANPVTPTTEPMKDDVESNAVWLVRGRAPGKQGIDASGFTKMGIGVVYYTKCEERPDGSIIYLNDDGTVVYTMMPPCEDH